MSAWVAFDDATIDNSCMWMVPGSHRWGNQIEYLRTFHDLDVLDGFDRVGEGFTPPDGTAADSLPLKAVPREVSRGRVGGRTSEIQRLIGRCLRSVTDLDSLGERTVYIDCDVIQADGGTRTASITGGWVALALALKQMVQFEMIAAMPLGRYLASTSVGIVDGRPLLDLCYEEDSRADVDMNVAMTSAGEYVEVQATAEGKVFAKNQLTELLNLAALGIEELIKAQREVISL